MPNAVDNFTSFYDRYRAPQAGAAAPAQNYTPMPPLPVAGNAPAYNPYATTYTPDPSRMPAPVPPQPFVPAQQQPYYAPANYGQPNYGQQMGPLTATLGSLKGIIKGKDYDKFVDQTAPVIDSAIPLIGAIASLFGGNKNNAPQPPQQPAQAYGTTVYTPNGMPAPQPTYPQPPYPQPGYQQPGTYYPNAQPMYNQPANNRNDWSVQVNQGVQGLAGLVNAIGGLFK